MSGLAPRVPDFFIVGHPKCGTTALYEMLRQHPEIFMPELKEPTFFSTDIPLVSQPRMGSPILPHTLEAYLALFAPAAADQQVGEASSLYLCSRAAPSAIRELNPAARIIAIFREPAAFLRSFHLQLREVHNESEPDLRRAIALEARRRNGYNIPLHAHRPQLLQYADHVRYTEQLRRYYAVFPREQVLVLLYEEFRNQYASTMRQIHEFLGVDPSIKVVTVEANPTVIVRSQLLNDIVYRYAVGRGPISRMVKAVLKSIIPQRARRRVLGSVTGTIVQPAPPADEALMAELCTWLKPEVDRFSEYLGRRLDDIWGLP